MAQANLQKSTQEKSPSLYHEPMGLIKVSPGCHEQIISVEASGEAPKSKTKTAITSESFTNEFHENVCTADPAVFEIN